MVLMILKKEELSNMSVARKRMTDEERVQILQDAIDAVDRQIDLQRDDSDHKKIYLAYRIVFEHGLMAMYLYLKSRLKRDEFVFNEKTGKGFMNLSKWFKK